MRKSCFSHAVEMKIDNCDVNDEHLRKMGSMQIRKLELVLCQEAVLTTPVSIKKVSITDQIQTTFFENTVISLK